MLIIKSNEFGDFFDEEFVEVKQYNGFLILISVIK